MATLQDMSNEDLISLNHELMAEKDKVKEQQQEIKTILDGRATDAFVETLSPGQIKAIQGVTASTTVGGDSGGS